MRRLAIVAVVLLGALAAGCGTSVDQAQLGSLRALNLAAPAAATTPPPGPAPACPNVTASLRPAGAMPHPGAMPSGTFMAQIQHRGYLVAGVDQNTLLFSYFNPLDGRLEGFEVDLLRNLALAIFGDANPGRIHFRAITTSERVSAVQTGSVDIVADAMTITCARKLLVDFSTVYYNATQRVLVARNAHVNGLRDLSGRRVCATRGSTSIANITADMPGAVAYPVDQRTDCLVALQQGLVDAVTSDDAILLGFRAQDPDTKIVGPGFSAQPYGMAIGKAHPDFVRFVNGWLAGIRADGTWQAIYARWLGRFQPTPAPPPAAYGGSS